MTLERRSNSMKLLGIIGGTGPESTIAYYRLLIATYQKATQDGSYPHLLINSVDNHKLLSWMAEGEFQEVITYLVEEVKRLAAAGADFGLLFCQHLAHRLRRGAAAITDFVAQHCGGNV